MQQRITTAGTFNAFLRAICLKHPNVNASWTPQRVNMAAQFREGSMGCQIDGILALITTYTTRIIIEVKPRPRHAREFVAAILSGRQRLAQG
jgi:hypothetical protein